jgi:hypothetical protein
MLTHFKGTTFSLNPDILIFIKIEFLSFENNQPQIYTMSYQNQPQEQEQQYKNQMDTIPEYPLIPTPHRLPYKAQPGKPQKNPPQLRQRVIKNDSVIRSLRMDMINAASFPN